MFVVLGLLYFGHQYWNKLEKAPSVFPTPPDETGSFLSDSLWADFDDLDRAVARIDSVTRADSIMRIKEDSIRQAAIAANANANAEEYAALSLDRLFADADSCSVRVVHYGDSQIEEDRISLSLRRYLQKRYGGGGVGILPLHQTVPTRTIRQELLMNGEPQRAKGGPRRYLVYGPKAMRRDNALYGPMGQVALLNDSLVMGSEDIIWNAETRHKKKTEYYFSRARIWGTRDSLIILPDSSHSVSIHLTGKQEIYGISLETPTGVQVDNIPMRGCSGYIFCQIDSTQLERYYRLTNTRLIILQFGGNMMPHIDS